MNKLWYQKNKQDQFIHRYRYDADNTLTHVYTSTDNILWHADARYFYYPDGKPARTELGEKQVQGIDYAYTIQGWLKAVNSYYLSGIIDPGQDAAGNTVNGIFAPDAFALSLQYYRNNYYPVKYSPSSWSTIPLTIYSTGISLSSSHNTYANIYKNESGTNTGTV